MTGSEVSEIEEGLSTCLHHLRAAAAALVALAAVGAHPAPGMPGTSALVVAFPPSVLLLACGGQRHRLARALGHIVTCPELQNSYAGMPGGRLGGDSMCAVTTQIRSYGGVCTAYGGLLYTCRAVSVLYRRPLPPCGICWYRRYEQNACSECSFFRCPESPVSRSM